MEATVIKPEKAIRSLWFVCWGTWFVIGLIVWPILIIVQPIVFGPCLFGWLIVMALVALWLPVFWGSLEYAIESDCVKSKSGVFWKKRITVPYNKITNIDITQGPLQRAFGIGTIHVQTAGAGGQQGTHAELRLLGISNLEQVKDTIMEGARGRTIAEPVQIKTEMPQSVPEVSEQILKELTAIRRILENR